MLCNRCCCNKCKHSVEIEPFLDKVECKTVKYSCFNCDECYYYGLDESFSRNKVKFHCDKFEMSNYYKEIEVKKRRRNFTVT